MLHKVKGIVPRKIHKAILKSARAVISFERDSDSSLKPSLWGTRKFESEALTQTGSVGVIVAAKSTSMLVEIPGKIIFQKITIEITVIITFTKARSKILI
jgi:hypothetical protein